MSEKLNFSNPNKKEFFDKYALEWDEMTFHDIEKLKFIVELLSLKPGQIVLDVGSGTGVMIPYLHHYVKDIGKIIAVDFSRKMIKVAKSKFSTQKYKNVKFIVQDINDINMNYKYDAILCYSCFPHFKDKLATIKHLAEGLKKCGKLMIAHSQSRESINNMHKDTMGVSNDLLPTMSEIEHMMESANLKVIKKIDNDEMFIIIVNQSKHINH